MDTTVSHKRGWSRWDKVLIWVIGVTVVLAALIAAWTKVVNSVPAVTIPTPTLPSPNAFDYFTAAGSAVRDDKQIGYAISGRHASGAREDHAYTFGEKEALVRENAPALKTLRQGFAYAYVNPPARSFTALFPYYADFRSTARLLALEGQVRAGQGDWAGAINSGLDSVQLGTAIPHGSVLIGDLVGIACQSIGRRPLWDIYSHLKASEARQAARRLASLNAAQVPFANALQEEKWMGQAGLLELFRSPEARRALSQSGDGS